MKHSESLKNIAPAICRAQKVIHGVVPDSKNPFFNSKYSSLEACWNAIKAPLAVEGISLIQTMGFMPEAGPTLITTLLHESGEFISGEQPICAKNNNPQEMGSAISYARRYGLSAIISLVEKDDDGEGAMNRDGKPEFASPAQISRLTALQLKAKMPDAVLKNIAAGLGITSRTEIPKDKYNQLCALVENWRP